MFLHLPVSHSVHRGSASREVSVSRAVSTSMGESASMGVGQTPLHHRILWDTVNERVVRILLE